MLQRDVTSADGTVIRAYWSPAAHTSCAGPAGASDASTIVLIADLGELVPDVWRAQIEHLGRPGAGSPGARSAGARFVTWEFRGTRRAGAEPPPGRYDVSAHLEDLCAVLQAAGIQPDQPFSILGSGVGVRLGLEAALAMPQRISGLVLIGGAAGWRYAWLCRASWLAARIAQSALQTASPARKRRIAVLDVATRGIDRAMRLADMSLREPSGDATTPALALEAIARTLRELGTAAVMDQAGQIKQPTLVLCGADDPRMPAAMAFQLARRLEHSWVMVVPRSASRLAHELPDLVNLELERFFATLPKSSLPKSSSPKS